jgi:Histidine kinase-, DNA gyrase B-, and HSP90-like ATPase
MIVTQSKANVITQGIQGAVSFGIKQDGLAHIFNVLRNQLYSNKTLAVLREYSCNAVDAHTEAGHNRPIEVTLPSRLQLELKIRDYGLGLSQTDIQEIYAFYGESTKRKSNSLIGQLGLGSKSAFAYGDNFVINSFLDGIKTTYNAYIDPSQIGQIATLASASTNEANGVEIVIPIKPADCETFVNVARSLFHHFKVKPIVKGVADFQYEEDKVLYAGKGWKMISGDRYSAKSLAIMGNIAYEVSASSLKLDENTENDSTIERLLANCTIHLETEIGDLDIAASREGLQYTEKTIASLKAKFLVMRDELVANVNTALKGANSLWSFKKMLGEMHDMTSPYYVVCNAMKGKKSYDYNGKKITDFSVDFKGTRGFKLYTPKKGYIGGNYIVKGGTLNDALASQIGINKDIVIVENTKGIKNGIINYIFPFLNENGKVIVCEFLNAQDRKIQLDKIGAIDSEVIDMKTLTKVLLPRNTRSTSRTGSTFAVRSKHTSKVFVLDTTQSLSSYHRVKSDYWTEDSIALDPAKHCYVEIERFIGKINGDEVAPHALLSLLKNLTLLAKTTKAKNIVIPEIVGVKGATELKKFKASKVLDIQAFVKKAVAEIERQTSCGEILYASEMFQKFRQKNLVLIGKVRESIDSQTAPNTSRLLGEIKTLEALANDGVIENSFNAVCKGARLVSTDMRQPRSAKLEAMQVKCDTIAHAMRLLQVTDSYNFETYRDDHKAALEAGKDYAVTRDHLLAGV